MALSEKKRHSTVTQFLSEICICESDWDESDISVTSDLFGRGRNLLRPIPLLVISQKACRSFEQSGIRGLSYEAAQSEQYGSNLAVDLGES